MAEDAQYKLFLLQQEETLRRKREAAANASDRPSHPAAFEPPAKPAPAVQTEPPSAAHLTDSQPAQQSAEPAVPEPQEEPQSQPEKALQPEAASEQPAPQPERKLPSIAPIVDDDGDMDVQPDIDGTDRAVSKGESQKVARPPRRGVGKVNAASADDVVLKSVRGIPQSMIDEARSEFPSANIGDAIAVFIAWKSGNHMGLTEFQLELLKDKQDADGDPELVAAANALERMSKQVAAMGKRVDELEVLASWVFLDRLGLRPAGTTPANVDAVELSSIPDLPRAMVRLRAQSEDVMGKVKVKEGRPRKGTTDRSQEVM